MFKWVLALLVGVTSVAAAPAAADAKPPKVDCTVFLYKPTTFWTRGAWRPKTMPEGWSTEDWFWHCSGRFRVQKQGPKRPGGAWGATVHLNIKNCTYQADEAWLRDPVGWRKADIYVSPWPS